MKTIPIEQISVELSPVVRAGVSDDVVDDYANIYCAGQSLPEPVVFIDEQGGILLADGRHRIEAASKAGFETIKCEVHQGGYADALRFALSANSQHGLRRTNADKRVCVLAALKEWPDLSYRKLAELCDVDDKTVAAIKSSIIESAEIRTNNFKTVGIKPEKEAKVSARQDDEFEVEYAAPVPPPVAVAAPASTMKPLSVPDPIRRRIDEIVREACKLQYSDPGYRHLVSMLLGLQKSIQLELPGMADQFPAKTKARGTQDEVVTFCQSIGLLADDGHWFYFKAQGCGWKNNGKAIVDWQDTCRAWQLQKIFPSQKPVRGQFGNGAPAAAKPAYSPDKELASLKRRGLID